MHRMFLPVLSTAFLMMSGPAQSRSLPLPPPYLSVSRVQYICSETVERSSGPIDLKAAGECRGYIRAIVDRYFATEFRLKRGQILPICDWEKTTDNLIAEVRRSVDGPIAYSMHSAAEPWLSAMLSKNCKDDR